MDEELEKFLGAEDVPEDQEAETPASDAADDDGDQDEIDQPEAEDAPQADGEPEKTVPLTALQQERQKGKELAQRIEALERQANQPQPQPQQQAPQQQVPDMFADPHGYQRYMDARLGNMTLNAQLNISEAMAREAAGDEAVEAALQAATTAGVQQQFLKERHPYGALLKWHQQQTQMAQIADAGGLEAYAERIRREAREEALREANADAVVKDAQSARAPSLAGKPNLGSRQGKEWAGPTSLEDILAG